MTITRAVLFALYVYLILLVFSFSPLLRILLVRSPIMTILLLIILVGLGYLMFSEPEKQ